jgi:HlyD family secretion protein
MNFLSNHKIFVAATVGFFIAAVFTALHFRGSTSDTTTYVVKKQDIKRTILASGTITSQSLLGLGFKNAGNLESITAKVGDAVARGQILAMLNEQDASAMMSQAKAEVATAEAAYHKLINGASSQDIDVAKTELANAQSNYDAVKKQQDTAVQTAYSAMLNSGIAAIPIQTNGSSNVIISGTYLGTEQGSYTVRMNGNGFDVWGLEGGGGTIRYNVPLPVGTKGLFVIFSDGGTYYQGATWNIPIPNIQASTYLTNFNAYQNALQNQSQALATAQAAVTQAQSQLALKQATARPEDVAIAEAEIATAKAKLEAARATYDSNLIISPINGIVTSVDAKLGEPVPAEKEVLMVLDPRSLHIEANVPESSIANISAGQSVDFTLDAFDKEKHFSGQVLSMAPAATIVAGVTNYKVIISIPGDQSIRAGMTASLIITTGEKQNVLAVPNEMVSTVSGKKVVTVVKDGTSTAVPVTGGLIGDAYTEIMSGISEGDVVSTTAIHPDATN